MQAQLKKVNLAVFASGSGSNAEAIINHFRQHEWVSVKVVITNNENAGVIDRAKRLKVPFEIITKSDFNHSKAVIKALDDYGIDWIVLAGWLLLVPEYIVTRFKNRIINIHPALLPKFGGKGMYGHHVHKAVKESNEKESGVTIHFVNERFDEGAVIAQYSVPINEADGATEIEEKVRALELLNYPSEIEKAVLSM